MVDGHDGTGGDGFSVPLRLHNLLLAFAGRVDDSALTEARELIAHAHLDEAVELTTGTLIAGRIPVRAFEQRELAVVLELSRSDPALADSLVVDERGGEPEHRFTGDHEPEGGVAEALQRTLQVLPDVRSVHAVWRNTPAGSVPGPLPQRVVLVEVGPDGNPPAAAFRIDTALRRAGIRAVVEVSGPGVERSGYHRAAAASAGPVWTTGDPKATDHRTESARSAPKASAVKKTPKQSAKHGLRPVQPSEAEVEAPEAATPIVPIVQAEQPVTEQPVKETRTERTADLTPAEVAQLRQALAEDPEKGREIAAGKPGLHEVVELPALDLEDPSLSDRDRALLRELHAELAERERAEAAKLRLNGATRGADPKSWS